MSWLEIMQKEIQEELDEHGKREYNEALGDVILKMHEIGLLTVKNYTDWVPNDITREKVVEFRKAVGDLWME